MSEKMQKTSDNIREQMLNRYGDELQHKHNKHRRPYRLHCRTHPSINHNYEKNIEKITATDNTASGLLREFKLRKIRTRLGKGNFH